MDILPKVHSDYYGIVPEHLYFLQGVITALFTSFPEHFLLKLELIKIKQQLNNLEEGRVVSQTVRKL
jgi:hypothetical protein